MEELEIDKFLKHISTRFCSNLISHSLRMHAASGWSALQYYIIRRYVFSSLTCKARSLTKSGACCVVVQVGEL